MAKKKHHHDEHIDETWLIPYADMLTLLLALFIVLFAVSQVDQKKFEQLAQAFQSAFKGGTGVMTNPNPAPVPPDVSSESSEEQKIIENLRNTPEYAAYQKEAESLQALKEEMDHYIQEQGLNNQIDTTLLRDGLRISIQDAALFPPGGARIRNEIYGALDTISKMLESSDNEVRIGGHTDNLPINTPEFPSNWDLSSKRALNVMKHILGNKKLEPARFTATGYGEYRPKETNDTAEGRAQNRRVEVIVIRKFQEPGSLAPLTPAAANPKTGATTATPSANTNQPKPPEVFPQDADLKQETFIETLDSTLKFIDTTPRKQ